MCVRPGPVLSGRETTFAKRLSLQKREWSINASQYLNWTSDKKIESTHNNVQFVFKENQTHLVLRRETSEQHIAKTASIQFLYFPTCSV